MQLQTVVASQGEDLTKLKVALDEESQKTTTLSAELEEARGELEAAHKRSDELAQERDEARERVEALERALRDAREELKTAFNRVGEVEETLKVSCAEAEKRGEAKFRASAKFAAEVMDQAAPLAEKAYEDCLHRARQLYPQLDFSSIALDAIYTDGEDSGGDEDDEEDEGEINVENAGERADQLTGQTIGVQNEPGAGHQTDMPADPQAALPAASSELWGSLRDAYDQETDAIDTTGVIRSSAPLP